MRKKNRALITGISGQDGAYLSKLLLKKGYEVYGAARRSASNEFWRLKELGILDQVKVVPFELLEQSNIVNTLKEVRPDEIYNLAAMSFVGDSFNQSVFTGDVNGLGVVRMLEAMRTNLPKAKFYQASTSEMFGHAQETPQNENTPFYPRSPYGCSKLYAHWSVVNYREAYGLHCSSGILFNHESPLRGEEFVTRKTVKTLCQIKVEQKNILELGNLNAKRDWGHAEDYVDGMYRMLQQEIPQDYVLATGKTHTIREFVNISASELGWELRWEGENENEKAYRSCDNKLIVQVNPKFYRPSEVHLLCGNAYKSRKTLKWSPKHDLSSLISDMIKSDLKRAIKL